MNISEIIFTFQKLFLHVPLGIIMKDNVYHFLSCNLKKTNKNTPECVNAPFAHNVF